MITKRRNIIIGIVVALVVDSFGISNEEDMHFCYVCQTGRRTVISRFWGIILSAKMEVRSGHSECRHEWKRIGGNTQYGPFGLVVKAEP